MLTITELYISRGLVLRDKGAVKNRGRELCGPCPSCGGDDRFLVWPEQNSGAGSYACRRCERAGDVIQFLMDFDNLTFPQAQKQSGMKSTTASRSCPVMPKVKATVPVIVAEADQCFAPNQTSLINAGAWQAKATKFSEWAFDQLMQNAEQLALLAARGLPVEAVVRYRLGWNPGDGKRPCLMRPRSVWGLADAEPLKNGGKVRKAVWLPRGLVIPQLDTAGNVLRLRIRRPDTDRKASLPDMKFYVVPGSSMTPLCMPQQSGTLPAKSVAVIVESELDALTIAHHAGDLVTAVGVMTATITRLPSALMQNLTGTARLLVALDADDKAGAEGWPRFAATWPQAVRWPVFAGKDPGEMLQTLPVSAHRETLRQWIVAGLPTSLAAMLASCEPSTTVQTLPAEPCPVAVPEPVTPSAPLPPLTPEERCTLREALQKTTPLTGCYCTPESVLRCLSLHGVRAVLCGDDYRLTRWERLPAEELPSLVQFSKRHAALINRALRVGERHA